MVKHIIFDIGNVLADFRWRQFLEDKGYKDEVLERIAQASVLCPLWNEYDRGVLTDEEILDSFVCRDPGIEKEIREAFADFQDLVTEREYAVPWIHELKEKGYGVYYLSNFSRKAHAECTQALRFISYTDGGILSYKERLIKPDHAIYILLLERYGLKAEECVFLDDTLRNVEAAREVGMYGIQFLNREQALEELSTLNCL